MKPLRYVLAGAAFMSLCSNPAVGQNYKWVTGTTSSLNTQKITKDEEDNTIISGSFSGNTDINFSAEASDSLYGGGAFMAKYDGEGNFAWAQKLGNGADSLVDIKAIHTDESGNVYVAGSFSGTVDFNPSPLEADTAIEKSLDLGDIYPCIYVAKYDSEGNFVWVMNLGGTLPELWDMKVRQDKLYITGGITTYSDAPEGFKNVDFDPSKMPADTFFLHGAEGTVEFELNPFFAVYSLDAELVTAQRINTSPAIKGFNIDADEHGNIYLAGNLVGTHDFDPSTEAEDVFTLTGTQGAFLASYNSAGAFRWAVPVLQEDNYGFVFPENPILLEVAGNGVYVSGLFKSTVDFNPGTATEDVFNLTASTGGAGSSYISHFDTTGNFVFAGTLQASGSGDRINALASDNTGHLYIAGEFNGIADFNLSSSEADTFNLKSAGEELTPDIFFAKYDQDTFVYARKIGNAESQNLSGMAAGNSSVSIFGTFSGDVIFNPMPPADLSSRLEGGGIYLATYRSSAPDTSKQLLSYSFASPVAIGTITASDSVFVTVPAGTDLSSLVADFTLSSPAAQALVGDLVQESGVTPNSFSEVVTYTIKAEDNSTKDYFVKVTEEEEVGIKDPKLAKENELTVWPNPSRGILYMSRAAAVKVYDIQGKLLLNTKKSATININHLNPGIYILENDLGQRTKIVLR